MRAFFRHIWNTQGLARWMLLFGVIITIVFLICAIFAPWIAPYDFNQSKVDGVKLPKLAPPSSEYWFGTNDQFYDVFSRVVWGARTALEVIVMTLFLAILIGVPLGIISGFVGGWFDRLLVFVTDAIYSLPTLLLAIVFAFLLRDALGSSIVAAALAITAVYIPQYFRVVRNTTIAARESTYIEAARALGAKPFTIMRKYLFGNVVQSVPVIGTLNAADALSTLAALGFLGFGIQPTEASEWGYDLSRALDDAQAGTWWPVLFPGLALIALIAALTLVGEGLNETLNPALRRRRFNPVVFGRREKQTEVVDQ